MEYNFGNNFRKSIDLTSKNLTEYIKTDFKYLIVPCLMIFGFITSIGYAILIFFENDGQNLNLLGAPILFAIILLLIFLFWTIYVLNWLIHSKAYHVLELYQKPGTTYKESLNQTVKSRLRVFIGTVISGLIATVIISILYFIFLIGIFLLIANNSSILASLFPFLFFFELAPGIIVAFLLIPLQIYPSVLLIEKDLGYIEGIKRSYHILEGWKNKVKFFACDLLLTYIVNFFLEFIFMGVLFGSLFAIIFAIAFLRVTGYTAFLVGIVLFAIVFSIFIIFIIEVEGLVVGNFYGQSYVNLVHPDLETGPVKKADVQQYYNQEVTYCTNCGQQLTAVQVFCPNCGQKR